MRGAICLVAIVLCQGCARPVERPVAYGVLHEPDPVDLVRERDTRMAVLGAVHPQAIRPDPPFVAATAADLLADDLQRLDHLLADGDDAAALDLVRTLIGRVRSQVDHDERVAREAATQREHLMTGGNP